MSRRVYAEINLHITWHTKNSLPMITASVESRLYAFLKNKIIETPDTYFHAVGGVADHIHLAVSVRPTIDLDKWIGQLKGASSHEMGKALQWQSGYGVVSFGTKDLKWVVNYILNQKQRHTNGTVHDRLERIEDDAEGG